MYQSFFRVVSFLLLSCLLLPMTLAAQELQKGERIVFLGDSITQAGGRPDGYVTLVRNSLHEKFADKGIEVINAGISGHKVPDLLKRLDNDVISKKPTLVVIYIGINDVWHSKNGRGTPKDVFRDGLKELIARIEAVNSRVILCTPSVIGEKTDGSNDLDAMLAEYAQISRDVAKETDTPLLDLNAAFHAALKTKNPENQPKGILTGDGVHLNADGNRFVADCMLEALGVSSKAAGKLRHIVMFKYAETATPEQIAEINAAFAALPAKIDVIEDFEMGKNNSPEGKDKGFTHCFVLTFANAADLDVYLPHPAHQAFVAMLDGKIGDVLVFDYLLR